MKQYKTNIEYNIYKVKFFNEIYIIQNIKMYLNFISVTNI